MCSYNEFVETYNNTEITAHDVRRITGLNGKQYCKLRNRAVTNGDIPAVRHMNNTNAKYYTEINGVFQVQKTIDGKKIIVGRFANEDTAKEIVDACISHNWDLDKVKGLIDLKRVKPKHYTRINGCWVIQKSINGRNTVFNSFSVRKVDEATVVDIVDFYEKNSWDINLKNDVFELFNIN